MLKTKNLEAGYGKLQVLNKLDFKIKPKEIVAIIGPNGAGKSTLLKSIFSLADTYKGEIVFRDRDITKLKTYELIYEGISYVPQGRQVFGGLSVKENLEMGGFMFKDKSFVEKSIQDMFEKFPFLKEKQDQMASSLSGGQQQILAIARSLIQNPQILLLDEPSLGLSPKAMKEVFETIKEIRESGVSIIIVEQNAKKAVEIADRTYVLDQGKVAIEGGKDILKKKGVKDVYFGGD
ncbi:MAG: ABC transporter ATP-binding protein [Candidatus Pacearchaeota archaeon]